MYVYNIVIFIIDICCQVKPISSCCLFLPTQLKCALNLHLISIQKVLNGHQICYFLRFGANVAHKIRPKKHNKNVLFLHHF